jgi:CDP-6-deoxy-D-xylo-4-hexulose-3-dehydrase
MLCLDDSELVDRALLLRRWGRRSEVKLFGSRKGEKRFFSDIDGLEYDDLFIFDELGWNFEPSELSAAFGVVQMQKLSDNLARRKRNFELLSDWFGRHDDVFVLPRTTPEVDTGWHMFPVMIRPESGVRRSLFQQHMERHGIDTRMVWTGNATRQPAFQKIQYRIGGAGLPNADRVMETGLVLPLNHAIDDDGIAFICDTAGQFLSAP